MHRSKSWLATVAAFALAVPAAAQIPQIVTRDGRHALIVDGAPFLMLGAQVNNSSAWPAMLPKIWPAIATLHANTLEVPIAWEQIEPVEGRFDFGFLDTLLREARAHDVRLVILWFGTWKNTAPSYAPAWVKLDNKRFPRMIDAKGQTHYALSPHAAETLNADRRAFVKLMEHIKAADPQNTIIMVQPENETGSYGSIRDYGAAAQKLFGGAAPDALVRRMKAKSGTWRAAFGKDADEYFHAWSIARYVDAIAAAGKAVKPLPMYVNAALSDPFKKQDPATYASGGPTHDVIDVWKVAAPHFDALAPDIYNRDAAAYDRYLDLYARADNPLFVPETGNDSDYARFFFAVLGHRGFGFAPFGMDQTGYANYPLGAKTLDGSTLEAFARTYRLFAPMARTWARLAAAGKVWGVAEPTAPEAKHERVMTLGKWRATASFGRPQFGTEPAKGNEHPTGGVAIAELGVDEYLVTGFDARVDFALAVPGSDRMILDRVEEGHYDAAGRWVFERVWNGDQTDYGLNFTALPQVLKVRLATYR